MDFFENSTKLMKNLASIDQLGLVWFGLVPFDLRASVTCASLTVNKDFGGQTRELPSHAKSPCKLKTFEFTLCVKGVKT